MRITTDFGPGDIVWKAQHRQERYWKLCEFCAETGQIRSADGNTVRVCPDCYGQRGKHDWKPAAWRLDGPYTVGKVSVEIIKTPDRNERQERYMCIETGVGSGSLHEAEDLFDTEEEARAACDERNAKEGLVAA